MRLLLALALTLTAAVAHADGPPILAHVEISESQGATRAVADHAVFISQTGDTGEIDVDVPGQLVTRIKLRLAAQGASTVVRFEVTRVGVDKASFSARGELALPPPGQRVVVARVPRPSGSAEVAISIGPSAP